MSLIWKRINTIILLLVLLTVAALVAMMATGVRGGPLDPPGAPGSTDSVRLPGTPISSVPYTITQSGHYYLTQNLAYSGSGNAIEIAGFVKYVSIDLGGFTLSGVDQGVGIKAIGPSAPSQYPLYIRNGYVRDFGVGLGMSLAAHPRIDDVHVYSNTGDGIQMGNHGVLSNCTSAINGGIGVLMAVDMAQVKNCMLVDNQLSGVFIGNSGNIVEESEILRNNQSGSADHANVTLLTVLVNQTVVRENNIAELAGGAVSIRNRGGGGTSYINNLYCNLSGSFATDKFVGNVGNC